jgi:5-methylcytosine-specific restriction endonuclease McrA
METLVLSSSFLPLRRVSWFRSMSWLLSGRVELVAEYEDQTVASYSREFKTPAVVRYRSKNSATFHQRRGVRFNRRNVWTRDGGRCQYCGKSLPVSDFTFDHVIPRHRGGTTCWENVVVCCHKCNQRKGSQTLKEAGLRLRATPKRPKKLFNFKPNFVEWEETMPDQWRDFIPN